MSTHISDNRNKALVAGYDAAIRTTELGIPEDLKYEDMVRSLHGWDVKCVERNGKPIGMAISKNGECHFCIKPELQGRWLTKGLLKEIGEKVDCRFTTVNVRNKQKQEFVEKIGFFKVGVKEENVVYQLGKLKFAGG